MQVIWMRQSALLQERQEALALFQRAFDFFLHFPMPKKYKEKAALIKKEEYPLEEAVELLTQLSTSTFDGTAEVHIRLNADPKQGDQQVRATVALPHGTGKTLRIAAIVPEDRIKEALDAGAVLAGE